MNKTIKTLAFIGSIAFSNLIYAIDYHLALSSEYIFRGVPQTNGKLAPSAGIDYSKDNFYIGGWISPVEYAGKTTVEATIELDTYFGYQFYLDENSAVDISYINYYFIDDSLSADEIILTYSSKDFTSSFYRDLTSTYNYVELSYLVAELFTVTVGSFDFLNETNTVNETSHLTLSTSFELEYGSIDIGISHLKTPTQDSDQNYTLSYLYSF